MDLRKVGQQYERSELKQETLKTNPADQLKEWMELALTAKLPYANAAVLATLDSRGYPQARIVLIKEIKSDSLTFFTNYNSAKGREMQAHNKVSLNIYWKELDRQVRISGAVSKLSREESEEYFYSRPRESQISAIASDQSAPVSKEELAEKVRELEEKYRDKQVEYPEFWGGYEAKIESAEFWQGRPNRLHDRFLYSKENSGSQAQTWNIVRLAP